MGKSIDWTRIERFEYEANRLYFKKTFLFQPGSFAAELMYLLKTIRSLHSRNQILVQNYHNLKQSYDSLKARTEKK